MNLMRTIGFISATLGSGLLSGCVKVDTEQPFEQPIEQSAPICKTKDFAVFIGQTEAMLAASTFQRGVITRTIKPGQPVTMDYSEARVNFLLDRNGVIREVTCG